MEAAKDEVIRNIRGLSDGVKLQVVAFNHYSRYLWPSGPKELDPATRQQAVQFVSNLRAGGGTNPWNGLWKSMQSQDVTQIILISDGYTSTSGYCNGRNQRNADCFQKYNKDIRADRINPLIKWCNELFPKVSTEHAIPWAGLRPMTPSMVPKVGSGRLPGVFYNTGHGHLGWTLSAFTSQQISDHIMRKDNVLN